MNNLKKNREFIIKYFNAISGIAKTRELCERYMKDDKLIEHIQFFEGAFPKYELFIEEMITEGNKVVVQGRATGIHGGEFNGIPPTGRKMDLPFVIRYTIMNEKIIDMWLIADQMILMEQLGVMTPQTIQE
ncbi:ester cyclase [Flagellimonas pacifica]|uniref:SnoaL-like polyketide cyclase n=1 Tax=Flagellimonas pacifica TaxID=1247520 RepID=A0A285MR73_9FLAO|nr:ester cyclase [Allomuricauda parva]SNY99655.1 SnoaL-like polyketide cyclase [Allomuricauda parva]